MLAVAVRLHHAVPQLDFAAGADRRPVHRDEDRHRERDQRQRGEPRIAMRKEPVCPHDAVVAAAGANDKPRRELTDQAGGFARYQATNSPVTLRAPALVSAARSGARAILTSAQPLLGTKAWALRLTRAWTGASSACCCAA